MALTLDYLKTLQVWWQETDKYEPGSINEHFDDMTELFTDEQIATLVDSKDNDDLGHRVTDLLDNYEWKVGELLNIELIDPNDGNKTLYSADFSGE